MKAGRVRETEVCFLIKFQKMTLLDSCECCSSERELIQCKAKWKFVELYTVERPETEDGDKSGKMVGRYHPPPLPAQLSPLWQVCC